MYCVYVQTQTEYLKVMMRVEVILEPPDEVQTINRRTSNEWRSSIMGKTV